MIDGDTKFGFQVPIYYWADYTFKIKHNFIQLRARDEVGPIGWVEDIPLNYLESQRIHRHFCLRVKYTSSFKFWNFYFLVSNVSIRITDDTLVLKKRPN
jgi:hypothetical protein